MSRDVWLNVMDRFDPELSMTNPLWRAPRPHSPAARIQEWLDIPRGIPRILMTGTTGTGKTTELQRIAQDRAGREFVVFVDLERHCTDVLRDAQALERVSAWEVCFLMGLALLRAAEDKLAFTFPEAHRQALVTAWSALAKRTGEGAPSKVDLSSLMKSMIVTVSKVPPGAPMAVGVGLEVLQSVVGATSWSIPFGKTQSPLADQESDVQTLLACVNTLIGLVQQRGTRILMIIDGLDRIREFARAKALFFDSTLISQLACPVVVCGPFALRHHPATAALRGFREVPPLVNEPVMSKANPKTRGPGIAFFKDVLGRRVNDLPRGDELFSPQQQDELAYYSGGRAREFVTLVHRSAAMAWSRDVPRMTDEIVEAAVDERRRHRETGLNRGHIRMLEEVARDHDRRLPEGPLAQELLDYGTLLPYPNESEWYYPHPLLLRHLIKI